MTRYALIRRHDRPPLQPTQVADAKGRTRDPTNTGALRSEFNRQIEKRSLVLRGMVSDALLRHDLFGINKLTAQNVAMAGSSVQAFGEWLSKATEATYLDSKGGWVGLYVGGGYKQGLVHARRETKQAINIDPRRGNTFSIKAANELRGIVAATEQQMNRAFSNGVVSRHLPRDIAAEVMGKVNSVLVTRAGLLVEHSVVNAHAEASLDAMESLGFTHVGLRSELCVVAKDAGQTEAERVAEHEPVKRVPRKKPKNWRQYVRFRTKGDEDVCPVCEDLEDEVFLIAEARGLIPVHPFCRCAFVPHFDKRYARDQFRCEPVVVMQ